ncbi:MAG: hypothetical protein SFZ03_07625 [Candidatus Melainabacteria bacterium]|nr:hypothetical protein [Candidatus Melainabacteria bacterium]
MRVEGIDESMATSLMGRLTYIEEMGLQQKVHPSSLRDNSGTRKIQENSYRGLDLYEVVKALNLKSNKLMVIRLMRRADWMALLFLLEKDQLIAGLRFFSKEKLLRLMTLLPKPLLLKMLLHTLPMEYLIQKLPTHEIFNILRSKKLTEKHMAKGFSWMDPKYLQFILMKITNVPLHTLNPVEMVDMLKNFKKRELLEGMKMLPFKALQPFVLMFTKQDPELLELLSNKFIFDQFDMMSKPTLLDAFQTLPDSMIIKFLSQLPDKFLQLVVAQIDEKQLEAYLLSQKPELLAMLAGMDAA